MTEAYVELTCPACNVHWEERPHELPAVDTDWECPECGDERSLAEFMDTKTDLEVVEQFHAESD